MYKPKTSQDWFDFAKSDAPSLYSYKPPQQEPKLVEKQMTEPELGSEMSTHKDTLVQRDTERLMNKRVYYCEACLYETKYPSNWRRHFKSQRHKYNVKPPQLAIQIEPEPSSENYYCKKCSYKTSFPSNWKRHFSSQRHKKNTQIDQYQILFQTISDQQTQNIQQSPDISQLSDQITKLTEKIARIENQAFIEDYRKYTVLALKNLCMERNLDTRGCTRKTHYISILESKPINVKKNNGKIPATLRNTVWTRYNNDKQMVFVNVVK